MSALQLHAGDNVATALRELKSSEQFLGVSLLEDIPSGHKFALQDIAVGESVIKYNGVIGTASQFIPAGTPVHVHNVVNKTDTLATTESQTQSRQQQTSVDRKNAEFQGYRRADGKVGTRNYIGILTSVNCSATVARQIAKHFDGKLPDGVDGVVALTHASGCGMANQESANPGLDILRRTMGGYARHPNFSAVLVIGLGCEVNQVSSLLEAENLTDRGNIHTLGIQQSGGAVTTIDKGIALVRKLVETASTEQRESCSASHLILGLQCGGSDAWSGMTANPALGVASDLLVTAGGSVLLAETPEIYGAEHLLLNRATSDGVQAALTGKLKWWQQYTASHGVRMDNNPTPGNIAGGITTVLEKSLGAVAKSGSSPLNDVIDYAQPVRTCGFSFMDSPGYDPCSVTGEIASGANLIAFTTGRGSTFGSIPAPCIKLGTNKKLAQRMGEDIDIDCSGILDGQQSLDEVGGLIFCATNRAEKQGLI